MYSLQCMAIAEYVRSLGGTVSIAHNGSGPSFVKNLLPFMSSAAIDIKATKRDIAKVLGLPEKVALKHYTNSFITQSLFHNTATNPNGAILDVRTPVFGLDPDPSSVQTTLEDMLQLGKEIMDVNDPRRTFWTWRLYKQVDNCVWKTPNLENVLEMLSTVSKEYPKQWMGIRAKWHGGGMLYYYGGMCVNPEPLDTQEKKGSGNLTKVSVLDRS
jgi:hypothetical protein